MRAASVIDGVADCPAVVIVEVANEGLLEGAIAVVAAAIFAMLVAEFDFLRGYALVTVAIVVVPVASAEIHVAATDLGVVATASAGSDASARDQTAVPHDETASPVVRKSAETNSYLKHGYFVEVAYFHSVNDAAEAGAS